MTNDLRGLDEAITFIRGLPNVVGKRGKVGRRALRKAALVVLRQEQANLQAVTTNATASGKRESTGLLAKNLIVSPVPSGESDVERYLVRVRPRIYPRAGQPVSTVKTAALLEFGSATQQAEPWIRPAVETTADEVVRVIELEIKVGIESAAQGMR